ncbi:glycosyltransferase [Microbacterium mangrovi]|uniref:glycosyltransferase n=1 Tax=Microbacterium mangrovi TaxID=1348253 RepID=UPI00069029C0|nr:glycosyltransferase [Microbacterium mangrovi]
MRVLIWHVHAGYATCLVQGSHQYLIPVDEERSEWGRGLAGRRWPHAHEVDSSALRDEEIDVVVLQRPEEIALTERLTGRVPGRDLPAVYLEPDAPWPSAVGSRHPLAEQTRIPIVHVTHFNRLFWDCGRAATTVIEHGVPDPGDRYTGELRRIAAVVNEPSRRSRVVGADLLPQFGRIAPVDLYGIGADRFCDELAPGSDVCAGGDLAPGRLVHELPRRRLYLHPSRWTSLSLSLLEAMALGMPVIAVAATEASRAVPPGAGVLSADVDELVRAARTFLDDPDLAREAGTRAREHVLARYGLERFLARWDEVLAGVVETVGESADLVAAGSTEAGTP